MKYVKESLKKYLAGFVDADGTIAFHFNKTVNGFFRAGLQFCVVQTEANDHTFKVMKMLHAAFGVGHLFETPGRGENHSPQIQWRVCDRHELERFLPHIIKYMVIKGRHFQRMLEKRRELAGKNLTEEEVKELKKWAKESRLDTGPLKHRNYPSPAWTAGYVDGDGCFRLYPPKRGRSAELRLKIASWRPDACALQLIQKAYGGRLYATSSTVNTYYLNMGKSFYGTAKKFLGDVMPHLRLKKHQAEMILHWHKQRLNEEAPTGEAIV